MVVFTFAILDQKYLFWANMVQKISIASLSWNLVATLNLNMENSVVMFTFSDFNQKYPFWVIWSKKSELSVYSEIWYQDYFEYAEFNGDVNFFCFLSELPFLGKN